VLAASGARQDPSQGVGPGRVKVREPDLDQAGVREVGSAKETAQGLATVEGVADLEAASSHLVRPGPSSAASCTTCAPTPVFWLV
jgi:hypothetical protein